MKTFIVAAMLLLTVIANAQYSFFEVKQKTDNFWNQKSAYAATPGSGYKQYERWKAYTERRIDETGGMGKYLKAKNAFLNASIS